MSNTTQQLANTVSRFFNRYAPAFITLLCMAVGFYFYYNVVLSKNEDDLKQRSFRGLNRIATNISGKLESYAQRNAPNFLNRYVPDSARIDRDLEREYGLQADPLGPPEDTVHKHKPAHVKQKGLDSFYIRLAGQWLFGFSNGNGKSATMPVSDFLKPLLRKDLFQHYFLAYRDTLIFNDLSFPDTLLRSIRSLIFQKDSTKDQRLKANAVETISIGGLDYRLFVIPFKGLNKYPLLLGGFLPDQEYRSEKNYIPIYAILWLVIGIVMVSLMFPLLKVILMHRSEQMQLGNAISTLASLHILSAAVILVLVHIFVYFNMRKNVVDNNLMRLADSLQHTATSEIADALREIAHDSALFTSDPAHYRKDLVIREGPDASGSPTIGAYYPFFTHVIGTDSAGENNFIWTTEDFSSSRINVSDRDYFIAVTRGQLIQWDHLPPFMFTAISSWSSTEKLAILATPIRTDSLRVLTLSGQFHSFFQNVFPDGYGFCITDRQGNVLFHQDRNRNLNENLVEECDNNATLQSLLQTRSADKFEARYSGTTQRFFVRPFTGLPYFIVTFRDMRTIWSEDLDVLSVSTILSLMNLGVILLAIVIIQACGYRSSLLHNRSVLFSWLRPNRSFKRSYRKASLFFLLSMAVEVGAYLLFSSGDPLGIAAFVFVCSFVAVGYAYYRYAVYSASDISEKQRSKAALKVMAALLAFVVVLMAISSLHRFILVTGGLIILFVGMLLLQGGMYTAHLSEKVRKWMDRSPRGQHSYQWWYITSLFCFMAATAMIPVALFYNLCFKEEALQSYKRNQLEFMQQWNNWRVTASHGLDTVFATDYRTPFFYQSFADSIRGSTASPASHPTHAEPFESFYNRIKPDFSLYSRKLDFLNNEKSDTAALYWQQPSPNELRLNYKPSYPGGRSVVTISTHPLSGLERVKNAVRGSYLGFLMLMAGILLVLFGIYELMDFLLGRIFFDSFAPGSMFLSSEVTLMKVLPRQENIFIYGPPNSGKYEAFKRCREQQQNVVYEFDTLRLNQEAVTDVVTEIKAFIAKQPDPALRGVILIRHFDLFADVADISQKKLELLEALLHEKWQIVILSSRALDAFPKPSTSAANVPLNATARWSNVLNNFYVLLHRWKKPANDALAGESERLTNKLIGYIKDRLKLNNTPSALNYYTQQQVRYFFEQLDRECEASNFLWGLRHSLLQFVERSYQQYLSLDTAPAPEMYSAYQLHRSLELFHEQVCLKVQSYASNYYLSLWKSLAPEEQRTLYDIAVDDIVNPANRDIAVRLCELGLAEPLKQMAGYQIMNTSFRNYIFTQLDQEDVRTIRQEADEKGSWNNLGIPLMLVVVGLSVFLFVTQREAFSNVLAYLGAAAGSIAALLKILGMIPNSKT